ncbi:MAG: TM0996/MTH895 family glutaredoxin-like protein [Candidatus Moranbacteria bacterium]|nr:TM0996/MTH895 family glutaredoxin-like protein [Candidatus Moranbacteria bacterium]
MKIKVLGSGCATCKKLYQSVQSVVEKNNFEVDIEYSTDIDEIVKLGAMSSPVLAIDNEVIVSGKVPTEKEIETYILEKINL